MFLFAAATVREAAAAAVHYPARLCWAARTAGRNKVPQQWFKVCILRGFSLCKCLPAKSAKMALLLSSRPSALIISCLALVELRRLFTEAGWTASPNAQIGNRGACLSMFDIKGSRSSCCCFCGNLSPWTSLNCSVFFFMMHPHSNLHMKVEVMCMKWS